MQPCTSQSTTVGCVSLKNVSPQCLCCWKKGSGAVPRCGLCAQRGTLAVEEARGGVGCKWDLYNACSPT